MIRPRLLWFIGVAVLAGCVAPGMGTISMDVTISGGQVLRLDLDGKGGFVQDENPDVRIELSVLRIDEKSKLPYYLFGFTEKKNEVPRKVTVEDVTDEVPVTLAVDTQPELKAGRWVWSTHTFPPTEKELPWLYQIENGARVYRYTIVTADGRTLVMHGATNYITLTKSYLRILLGVEKKAP